MIVPIRLEGNKLYFENNVLLGEIIMDVDGFYYFWPDLKNHGAWDDVVLHAIADLLRVKNVAWQEKINNDPRIAGDKNPE